MCPTASISSRNVPKTFKELYPKDIQGTVGMASISSRDVPKTFKEL